MSTYLVCISDIPGEGTSQVIGATTYTTPIECSSMQHGIDLPVVAKTASRAAGYSMHGSIAFRHALDKATPKLRQAAAKGTVLDEVTILHMEVEGAASVVSETIRLGKTTVASVGMETPIVVDRESGDLKPAGLPYEMFELDYEEIVWERRYVAPVAEGTVATASTITGGWDTDNQTLITTIPAVTADP